ncbi:DNA replication complex GINS family protein [Candidatus Woesearchaeota archaeon]|nr:DNA replication complex GINS family protein [Candidatus Woesearchaeota archaeon]
MGDVIITYETLYELLMREKSRAEIQKLDNDFFNDVIKYIKDKKDILDSQKSKENVFAAKEIERTTKQLESIYRILKELYEKRENKIFTLALLNSRNQSKIDTSLLLAEELKFYENIKDNLNIYRKGILGNILEGKFPVLKEPKVIKSDFKNKILIRFINSVPKFIGSNGFTYGPYEEEDIANLPEDIAKLMIEKGRAEEI